MLELYDQIEAAAATIRAVWNETPHAGVILGTGLGNLAAHIDVAATLDYADIPHFPTSTVESHRSRLVCGRLGRTIAQSGKIHCAAQSGAETGIGHLITFASRMSEEYPSRRIFSLEP